MREQNAGPEVVCNLDGPGSSGTESADIPRSLERASGKGVPAGVKGTRHESIKLDCVKI